MITRETIKRIPLVGKIVRFAHSQLTGAWRLSPSYWIPKILPERDGIAVQIGSNDGRTGDPLHGWLKRKKGWSAVFVEPVPFLYERLKKTYSGEKRFSFENAVINEGEEVAFYWVSEDARSALPDLPPWYDQLGGFNRDHITNHIPDLEPFIQSATLKGITLVDLFDKYKLDFIDLLHIDTEGADFRILSQLDLKRFRPRLILYERKHLSKDEENESIRFLQASYMLYNLGADILAVKKESQKAVHDILKPLSGVRLPDL